MLNCLLMGLSSTRPHPGVGRPGAYIQKGVSPVYGLHVSERVFPSDNGPWGTDLNIPPLRGVVLDWIHRKCTYAHAHVQ